MITDIDVLLVFNVIWSADLNQYVDLQKPHLASYITDRYYVTKDFALSPTAKGLRVAEYNLLRLRWSVF